MCPLSKNHGRLVPVVRAIVEIAFIVFLFYSNLLMGEFNRRNAPGKTLAQAFYNVVTPTNFVIAMISAAIGYMVFEHLRKRL